MAHERLRSVLLKMGRSDFPEFYSRASPGEAKQMDMAILLTALKMRLKRPGMETTPPDEESQLTAAVSSELRYELVSSPTFVNLSELEKEKIQRVIFNRML